jgi:hypothetical protein
MPKYRVVRGGIGSNRKPWSVAVTVEAPTAREAVEKNAREEFQSAAQTFGGLIAPSKVPPVINVYELVQVPKDQWN